MTVKITVDDKEVQKAFDKLIRNVESSELSLSGAEVVFALSQDDVPVDTGELRDSGEVKQSGDDATVTYTADHAMPVEFGTSKMAAQPYLRPAIDNHKKVTAEMGKKFKQQVSK